MPRPGRTGARETLPLAASFAASLVRMAGRRVGRAQVWPQRERRSGQDRRSGTDRRTTDARGVTVVARVWASIDRRSGVERRSGIERRREWRSRP